MLPDKPLDWPGQYILSRTPIKIDGWRHHRVDDFHLTIHPNLPVSPLPNGALIGWAVHPDGYLATEPSDRLGGRWLLIQEGHLYPDPSASQPIVYTNDIVASSPSLIEAEPDEHLITAFDVVASDRWYPFGLTPKRGVKRLLPNHALDLTTFEARRIHKTISTSSLEAVATALIGSAEATARAFSSTGLLTGLTAGRDSRMLLAALRQSLKDVIFCTSQTQTSGVDVDIARKIARRFDVPHTLLKFVPATSKELSAWQIRVGGMRAGNQMINHRLEETAFPDRPFGHGAIGELARGTYWLAEDRSNQSLTAKEAIKRIGAPEIEGTITAAQMWIDQLPDVDKFSALDLLYLEQRVGCWAAAGNIGSRRPMPLIFLMNRQDVIDGILGLSEDDRRNGHLIEYIIHKNWPELLDIPFNPRPSLWNRIRRKIRKLYNLES